MTRSSVLLRLAFVLVPLSALCTGFAVAAAPKTPVGPRLVSLRLEPAAIALSGPLAAQRLLVTARASDGSEVDVTERAAFRLTRPGVAKLDKAGALTPVKDGGTEIVAQIGALVAKSPVMVKDAAKRAPVSLVNDIEPALTWIGCNQAACHGQQNGKGGFKLSLRGWDPAFDWEQMTKDAAGKRVFAKNPARSLLLLKPLGEVPHGGGKVLDKNSAEYALILRWLREGAAAPGDKDVRLTEIAVTPAERILPRAGAAQRLLVSARYSDGTVRDVTRLARYQSQNDAVAGVDAAGRVAAKGPGESALMVSYGGEVKTASILVPFPNPTPTTPAARANYVDEHVAVKLAKMRIPTSSRATDAEFLRRVTLDTIATLPTPAETRVFLADKDPNKRARLIDRLLARPEYVDYRTLKLADLLRVNGQYLSEEGADVYYRWIHEQVQRNVPYDQFVRDLLGARGSTFRSGPANYFRVAGNPEDLAETTAQSFLGTRIACAKCHNHPFERWKQSDYYGLAAFFVKMGKKGGPEFGEEQVYNNRRGGETVNPRTKQVVAPKYLGGDAPKLEHENEGVIDRRVVLADWLTSKNNFDFARVAVNRIWADYFGKGIVDPVDDFRVSNPPANAPLLDALAKDFIAHDFDVKYITRVILNSETYGRSSEILPGNTKDTRYFSRFYPRRLPAEALMDTIAAVTEKSDRYGPYPPGWRATQIRDSRIGAYFLEVFGRPKREILCACERSPQPNLAQSLHLINSPALNSRIAADDGRVSHLLKQFEKAAPAVRDRRIVEEMYLLTLSRPPTKTETADVLAYLAKQKEPRKGYEDALWALLNSEEFLFNK